MIFGYVGQNQFVPVDWSEIWHMSKLYLVCTMLVEIFSKIGHRSHALQNRSWETTVGHPVGNIKLLASSCIS